MAAAVQVENMCHERPDTSVAHVFQLVLAIRNKHAQVENLCHEKPKNTR
jgi:hypothetical protein